MLLANLNSFSTDYVARQKVGGTHITYNLLKQFPLLSPGAFRVRPAFAPNMALSDWLAPRIIELTYTAYDLNQLARDCGYDGPPFAWDPNRRFELRCEPTPPFPPLSAKLAERGLATGKYCRRSRRG